MPAPGDPQQTVLHKQAEPHSVELSLTAAGRVTGTVKIYAASEQEALERAAVIFDAIRKRYPNEAK